MAITIIPECTNNCPACGDGNYNFCGVDTVESEICLVPAISTDPRVNTITVTVDANAGDFNIELICCNLIVVCGFITKTVVITSVATGAVITKRKRIPVQIKVPAEICDVASLDSSILWDITGVEVCTGCYTLTCPTTNLDEFGNVMYHKLVEKDIIGIQVDRTVPIPTPPGE
jgi:hypothetical protein